MSKKFLGKVITGAALAGATLLIATPGIAAADGGGGKPDHDKGYITTYPRWVKPGHEVKVVQYCEREQHKAWAWSKPTGKLWLEPWSPMAPEVAQNGLASEEDSSSEDGMRPGNDSYDRKKDGKKDEGYDRKKHGSKDGVEPLAAPEEENGSWDRKEHGKKDGVEPTRAPMSENDSWDGKKHGKDGVGDARESGEREHSDLEEWYGGKDGKKKHFVYWSETRIPWDARPGVYKLKGSCAYGKLIVAPNGAVDGGDGGTGGADTGLAVGGASALAVAGLGGLVLMRRRKADGALA